MRGLIVPAIAATTLVLGGCAKHEPGAGDMAAPEATSQKLAPTEAKPDSDNPSAEPLKVDDASKATKANEKAVPAPQIAYNYVFGFRISGDKLATLEQRHAELCESKGPTVCRIISMQNSGGEGDYAVGTLELDVVANKARAFSKELEAVAKTSDGEPVSAAITGEDLSKQIVDTEARLRARILLRDRLMEILQTRKGSVAELVEAERGVAQVNEEIDQAQSWLAEMRGRVAFSHMTLNYNSEAPGAGGFMSPIRSAVGSLGSIMGTVIAALIVIATALIPIGIVVGGCIWAVHRLRRSRRTVEAETGATTEPGSSPPPGAG